MEKHHRSLTEIERKVKEIKLMAKLEELKTIVEKNAYNTDAEDLMYVAVELTNLLAEDSSIFWEVDELLNNIAEKLYNAGYYEDLFELAENTGYGREYIDAINRQIEKYCHNIINY